MKIRFSRAPILLALILIGAFGARVYGINFPRYHWDENLNFDSALYAARHALALGSYVHGSFFPYLILTVWTTWLMLNGAPPGALDLNAEFARDFATFALLARAIILVASVATVGVTYLLGARLYSRAVGLLAAFFLAFTFLHVSESHYARSHVLSAFWMTSAVYWCARVLDTGRARDYVCAGICIGLATAAQYSAVLGMFALVSAHLARGWNLHATIHWRAWLLDRAFLLGLNCAALTFFSVTPYALLNFPYFAGEMKWFLTEVVSHTWVDPEGQPVFLFYLTEHLRNGMGLGFEIVAFAGLIYALYRHQTRDWILLAFPLPLLLALAKGENFARYALPLLPFFAIAAARVLNDGAQFARARWATGALIAFALALMLPSARNIARYDFWLTQPDTRAVAAQWIATNIPRDARIVIEGAGVLGPTPPAASARVETVFRLDESHEGGMFVRQVARAQTFIEREVEYLVTVSWMQRADQASYSAEFQRSLVEAYAPIVEFAPTIEFRFDPYAWRMDYAALEQIVPGTPGMGGPRVTIYRRRGMP